jgi:hypothetical protein
MATWRLNPALTNFREAVNAAYPGRDKTSDGTIGDLAHQGTASDHNPDPDGSVDAWDMDVELYGPGKPAPAEDLEHLKAVFQAHESSKYWIHNRVIASRDAGWKRLPYTGLNPHDKHVHWNTRSSHENSTAPWVIREGDVAVAYRVQSVDAKYNGRVWLSNGINRRGPIRAKGVIEGPALTGAVEVLLTDAMRLAVNVDTTWEEYLDAVAGKELVVSPWAEHTHLVGPAVPGE